MPYVDLISGIIHLSSEITYDNTIDFLATLRQMDQHADVAAITVHITAHGGALMPAVAIVQALQVCRKPVTTIGSGYVASAALPILAAGQRGQRQILEGTTLLLHQPTHTMGETSRKSPGIDGWKHEVAFHEQVGERYYWCLARCSDRPTGFWRDLLGSLPTRMLEVDEALSFGLIDHVVPLKGDQTVLSTPV